MKTSKDRIIDAVTEGLKGWIGNENIIEWIEITTEKIFDKFRNENSYIDFNRYFLKERNIHDIIYTNNSYYPAYLQVVDNGFYIYINEKFKNDTDHYYWRYLVLHEYSHTIFFNLNSIPPKDMLTPPIGHYEREWIVDYTLRSIIMPIKFINTYYPPKIADDFFWKVLNHARRVDIGWGQICRRIIQDLIYYNALIFVIRYKEKTLENPNNKKKWRIVKSILPPRNERGLFIPADYNEPSINNEYFVKELNDFTGSSRKFSKSVIESNCFNGIGNLGKWLRNKKGVENVTFRCYRKRISTATDIELVCVISY